MTKQQKTCAIVGGVFGLCVLALGWFLYSAYAERQEIVNGGEETPEGLEAAKAKYGGFFQQKPFPSVESVRQVKANGAAYAQWRTAAREVAEKGSFLPPSVKLDHGDLKIMLKSQVARMQKLNNGEICAPAFQFGFEPYLDADDKKETPMPTDPAELTELYTQFVSITNVVDILHANGVQNIRRIGRRQKPKEEDSSARQSNQRRRKNAKDKAAKAAEADDTPACHTFELEYTVRPTAFVNVLNAFAKSPRFYVVDNLSFGHEGESLKERLNRANAPSVPGGVKQEGRRRRSPGRSLDQQEEKKTEKDDGLVTRPDKEQPILVKMKLSVYDFGKDGASSQKEGN